MLDEHGCYSMDLVRAHDQDWCALCENKGMLWECLSSQMDVEEPEAAMIISVSLNKTNEASMKTSHTEIMNTLVGLCAPSTNDVEGKVPLERVREQMI